MEVIVITENKQIKAVQLLGHACNYSESITSKICMCISILTQVVEELEPKGVTACSRGEFEYSPTNIVNFSYLEVLIYVLTVLKERYPLSFSFKEKEIKNG